jgi:peptidoglycan L-alanyl-D-glutamate endopeptidase CwlK
MTRQRYKFSKKSLDNLVGVHPALCDVVQSALLSGIMDFRVAEGLRTKERQAELVASGASKTMNSKHLIQPDGSGHAVDLYPCPIDMVLVNNGVWKEIIRFGVLAGIMKQCAKEVGVTLVWGGDFDSDGETLDQKFMDTMHFQLELP